MMPRSSVIFWLLLAATVAVDAAVTCWWIWSPYPIWGRYLLPLISALYIGQLSIISIWLVFRPVHDLWSWLMPLGGLLAVSIVRDTVGIWGGGWATVDYASRSALQMLILIIPLQLLKHSTLWGRLTTGSAHAKWRYSVRQLLVVMSMIAILSAIVGQGTRSETGLPIAFFGPQGLVAPAVCALSAVVLTQLRLHWLIGLATYLTAGALVGITMAMCQNGRLLGQLAVEFMIEAVMIAIWITWGGIVNGYSSAGPDAA